MNLYFRAIQAAQLADFYAIVGSPTDPRGEAVWDRLAQCETGGDWSMHGSIYSGGTGFANSTWDAYGGRAYAPQAGAATREQQIDIDRRVQAAVGWGAWGCARTLGLV